MSRAVPLDRRIQDTAAVSVGRFPIGACFEPVKEFDPRPVRNNIGDAQLRFGLR